jgi:hypothetical protein
MDLPIDKYYTKQENARKLLTDTENPITEAVMVMQLTQHLAKVGGLGKQAVKFKKRERKPRRTSEKPLKTRKMKTEQWAIHPAFKPTLSYLAQNRRQWT